ncbi:MAG: tetratricopeptide repeat protein, partial [Leptolyngbya sp. SIO1D8]|nr:tetratricopeptide repeat protein [Leptolyngbya sp. SIO1D8]
MKLRFKRPLRSLLIALLTVLLCISGHPAIAQLPSPAEQFQQGQQAYLSGQYTQAADLWQAAADGYATDPIRQAMTLSNLGLSYLQLGRYNDAEGAIAAALELAQSVPETPEQQQILAQALSAQAQYQQEQGNYTAALQSLTQAQEYYTVVDDAAGIMRSQLNQAQIFGLQGRHRQALTLLNQVAEQLEATPNNVLKANGLRQLGNALRLVEDAEKARMILEVSLQVAQTINAPDEQGATLISLGNTAEVLGQTDEALRYYRDAAAIAPAPTLQLQARVNYLRLLQSERRLSEAQAQLREILQTLDTLPPGRSGLFVRINLVDLLVNQDAGSEGTLMSDRAVAALLAATLQQAETVEDVRSQSYALGYLGKLYQKN